MEFRILQPARRQVSSWVVLGLACAVAGLPSIGHAIPFISTTTELTVSYTQLPSVNDVSAVVFDASASRSYVHDAPGWNGLADFDARVEGTSIGANATVSGGMVFESLGGFTTTNFVDFSLSASTLVIQFDTLSVLGLGAGEVGTLEYVFLFGGSFRHLFNPNGGALRLDDIAGEVSLAMTQSGETQAFVNETFAPGFTPPAGPVDEGLLIGDIVVVSPAFGFEDAALFPVSTTLRVDVGVDVTGLDAAEFFVTSNANFGSTAELLGVRVYDDTGALRTDVTVSSENGFQYAVLPEPATGVLLALGIAGIALRGSLRIAETYGCPRNSSVHLPDLGRTPTPCRTG